MKYHITTYGCQMNHSDSERLGSFFKKSGYQPARNVNEADLIVINACSIRQKAIDRIHGDAAGFKQLKKQNPNLKTILTGCVLPKDKKKFSSSFDVIADIKELTKNPFYLKIKPAYSNRFSALVPIMTGCNNFCAYCAVPYTRGREISRPAKEIISEIKSLVKKGYKEIWLLGQNVNSYRDIPFYQLLRKINQIPGNFWIRFTSSHPKDFSNELIRTMAECKKVTEYLNLPVQAGDDKVLKRMKRPYKIADYKKITKKIRKEIPDIGLSTDVIVGFAGETKKQFQNTVKLFKEIKYDMAYISEYSSRPGTFAAKNYNDNVTNKEKDRRKKALDNVLRETALKNSQKYLDKNVEVLVDKKTKDNIWKGKTRTYKTVQIDSSKNLLGKFVQVKIISAQSFGMEGELIQK